MSEPPAAPVEVWRQRIRSLGGRARGAAPFGLGVVAALVAMAIYGALFPAPAPLSAGQVSELVAQAQASATPAPARSSLVYQVIAPSLVLIQTEGAEQGLGSGVVVDDRGSILTSLHVVQGATAILVTFADGTQAAAQVIASLPEDDIAVLAASQLPAQLVPATLGNPGSLRVGDEAYVVGHPLGLYGSMSAGVISGLDRSFQLPDSGQEIEGLIQVDAAVNPGNSGGPLLNRNGQVIGIVAGLMNAAEQDVFAGIGFAVPIDVAGGAAGLPSY